jgi:hypothetical protein
MGCVKLYHKDFYGWKSENNKKIKEREGNDLFEGIWSSSIAQAIVLFLGSLPYGFYILINMESKRFDIICWIDILGENFEVGIWYNIFEYHLN